MPFRVTNAPAVFQDLVNDVLRYFLNRFGFDYLDDILIFSKSLHQHKIHVQHVLQRLMENRLYIKAEKREFHVPSITIQGYILDDRHVRADPAKLQIIKDRPIPKNRKHLQRLIGFANSYHRFIHHFKKIVEPLNSLSSTKKTFKWTL